MKILRRRVFIRKNDFPHLRQQALSCGYTSAEWHALDIDDVAKELTFMTLQNKPVPNNLFFSSREFKARINLDNWCVADQNETLARRYIEYVRTQNLLYHKPYTNWSWQFENNRIEIRAKTTCAWQPMGVAVLERIY